MLITELRLLNRSLYNTDKFDMPSETNAHLYGDFYDQLLKDKEMAKINLLEIGVQRGPSVRLFHDYLKRAHIYGVDIVNEWDTPDAKYNRLKLYFFDAYVKGALNSLPINKFDIIIDDGPHTIESQIYAIENFTEYLTTDGILIIEDVPVYNLDKILDTVRCDKNKIKVYNYYLTRQRGDDVIITINK